MHDPTTMAALREAARQRQAAIERRLAHAQTLVATLLEDHTNPHFATVMELYGVLHYLQMDVARGLEVMPEWVLPPPEHA